MPELPEAETIARDLRRRLPGATVREVEVHRPDVVVGDAGDFADALAGLSFIDVGRRGKNLVLRLEGDAVVAVNLGMTGRLLHVAGGADDPSHLAVAFRLDGGARLLYDDVRRFGRLELFDARGWEERSAELGPEPLDDAFGPGTLEHALARSRAPVRSFLLDQRRLAGVGNIYAIEALHRARIDPRRPARSLSPAEARRLHGALREVLAEAIRHRGTTIRDYRDASGESGGFVRRLRVYDREGEACPRCGAEIVREVFGGRSAYRCPGCQPRAPEADGGGGGGG